MPFGWHTLSGEPSKSWSQLAEQTPPTLMGSVSHAQVPLVISSGSGLTVHVLTAREGGGVLKSSRRQGSCVCQLPNQQHEAACMQKTHHTAPGIGTDMLQSEPVSAHQGWACAHKSDTTAAYLVQVCTRQSQGPSCQLADTH